MGTVEVFQRYTFSGHESFQCRQLWLKKGYDFVDSGKSFNDEDAVVELGVGKNMVSSIRYWMKAFNILTNDDELTSFGKKLLDNNGWDPYLEDEASLWLLHYQLVTRHFASTYNLIFNELRREKIEFSKENYVTFVKRKADSDKSFSFNEKTLRDDIGVFVKMYLRSNSQTKDKEDSFSGLLADLELVRKSGSGDDEILAIENTERPEIPEEVILYGILETYQDDLSINFSNLEGDHDSIGSVFALSRSGILDKVKSLPTKFPEVIYTDNAGVKELQFKSRSKLTSSKVLDKYYAN